MSGEGHAVKREVPGREPRVLPLVRHRHHAHRVEVPPVRVARLPPPRRRLRRIVAVEPLRHVEQVALLAPQEARERAALDQPLVRGRRRRREVCVEHVRLMATRLEDRVDVAERIGAVAVAEPQPHHRGAPRRDHAAVVQRDLGAARLVGADRARLALAQRAVERVLRVPRPAHVARPYARAPCVSLSVNSSASPGARGPYSQRSPR